MYALDIQLNSAQKNTKRLKELYHRALTIKSAIPHPRIMGIIRECGGKMHMTERLWQDAATDFFEVGPQLGLGPSAALQRARASSGPHHAACNKHRGCDESLWLVCGQHDGTWPMFALRVSISVLPILQASKVEKGSY